jgi:hypothetical protein
MVSDGDRKSRNPAAQQAEHDSSIALEMAAPLLSIINRRRTTEHFYCSPSSLIDMEGSTDGPSRNWEKKN